MSRPSSTVLMLVALHRVQRLFSRASRHHVSWQAGGGGADRAVAACVAEGLGIRATARVFEVAPHPGLQWLGEAAVQRRAFSHSLLCDMHVEPWQLDALYVVLRALKAGAIGEDEAIQRLERSPSWVWMVMAPESTLLLVIEVGTRTLAMAQRVVQRVAKV